MFYFYTINFSGITLFFFFYLPITFTFFQILISSMLQRALRLQKSHGKENQLNLLLDYMIIVLVQKEKKIKFYFLLLNIILIPKV
jgi:hypothetical protein